MSIIECLNIDSSPKVTSSIFNRTKSQCLMQMKMIAFLWSICISCRMNFIVPLQKIWENAACFLMLYNIFTFSNLESNSETGVKKKYDQQYNECDLEWKNPPINSVFHATHKLIQRNFSPFCRHPWQLTKMSKRERRLKCNSPTFSKWFESVRRKL